MKKLSPLTAVIKDQLSTRSETTLKKLFEQEGGRSLFVESPDDWGVARNGGRRGARFAPQAILSALKSFQNNSSSELGALKRHTLESTFMRPQLSFEELQSTHTKIWQTLFSETAPTRYIHLGGGHDHIYPLLAGYDLYLNSQGDKRGLTILNLDAHLDTRVDHSPHSGTPFRQFAQETKRQVHMIQWGIHFSANSKSTCEPLPKPHRTTLVGLEETKRIESAAKYVRQLAADDHLIISLDADAIDGSELAAVSAVNPRGLRAEDVFTLVGELSRDAQIFGIYEYNPVFDDLSNYGARMLAKLILTYLER